MINCVNIFFSTPSLTPIQKPLPNLVNNSRWKRKLCRLTLLIGHPLHAFSQDKKKYHQSASVLHLSAPLMTNCVKKFLQQHPSHPYRHPCQILLTTGGKNGRYAASHSFKNTPFTPSPRTTRNTTDLPVFYTLVRLQFFFCVKIVFATISLTPTQTPLVNLVNNSWWKPMICRLTLLQEHPLHAFAQDKKKYHQTASFYTLVRLQFFFCVKIVFATISLTPTQTLLVNLFNNSWWERKMCRLTLLQEDPLHAFAQDKKKYHQSASVLHLSAP